VLLRARQLQAGFAVVSDLDRQAVLAQSLGQKTSGLLFVFDQQHVHLAKI
jgi:hypothetical protein